MNDTDTPHESTSDQTPPNDDSQCETNTGSQEAGGASGRKNYLSKWCFVGGAVVVAAALGFVYYKTPNIVAGFVKQRMVKAGLDDPNLRIDNVGPFYAEASGISFTGELASVTDARGQAGYSPTDVVLGGPVDTATVENAHAVVDVDKVLASSKAGKFSLIKLPFALPKALSDVPARNLLVRGAEIDVKAGGEVKKMSVDTLSRQSLDGTRSATFSINGENGDTFIVGVEGHGENNSISAEGSMDVLGWFLACNPSIGVVLPEKVGIESSPLVVQFILNENNQKPGKWVGVISQPWFQYEKGPLSVLMQDARAGVTGENETLKKAAAEADFKVSAGPITIGPFHPVASANSKGETQIRAESIPVEKPGAKMKIDYTKLSTNILNRDDNVGLRGTIKPSWLPCELAIAVSVPSTLDGVFVDMSLPPTKLSGVSVPPGWLPKFIEGIKVTGMVDCDLNITAGGMTANGLATTARISVDDSTFELPVGKSDLVARGVRVVDARIASVTDGFSVQLSKGLKADSVTYGDFVINDLQLWPCRIVLPGDASIGSSTASFMGGRIVTSAMRGTISSNGIFVPATQFEISASGLDLEKISALAPQIPGLSGSADVIMRVTPPAKGESLAMMHVNGSIKSTSFVVLKGGDSISLGNINAEFEYNGANGDNGPFARIRLLRPIDIVSFKACGVTLTGSANLDGWIETSPTDICAALAGGLEFAAKSSLRLNLRNAGLSVLGGEIDIEGVNGTVTVEQDGKNPRMASDGDIGISSIKYRTILMEDVAIAFQNDKETGLSLRKFKADFCDGTMLIKDFAQKGDAYKFKLVLADVSASSLVALFPSFKGKVEGRLGGELNLKWEKGVLTVYPGNISLKPSSTGRFSYSDPSIIMNFMKNLNETMRLRASRTIENMAITSFSVAIDGANKAPVQIHIVGDGIDKNGTHVESEIPIDAVINVQGDVADAIAAFIGKNIKVKFAPAE